MKIKNSLRHLRGGLQNLHKACLPPLRGVQHPDARHGRVNDSHVDSSHGRADTISDPPDHFFSLSKKMASLLLDAEGFRSRPANDRSAGLEE
jgi:hypothetical protein